MSAPAEAAAAAKAKVANEVRLNYFRAQNIILAIVYAILFWYWLAFVVGNMNFESKLGQNCRVCKHCFLLIGCAYTRLWPSIAGKPS
jgi:hypothetical protein